MKLKISNFQKFLKLNGNTFLNPNISETTRHKNIKKLYSNKTNCGLFSKIKIFRFK